MNSVGEMLFNWAASGRAAILRWQFCSRKDAPSLQAYLEHLILHDMPLNLENKVLRDRLFKLSEWRLPAVPGEFLLVSCEAFLAHHTGADYKDCWHGWIEFCRLAERKIDVTGLQMSTALREAHEGGALEDLPADDRIYLLELYRGAYANVLGNSEEPNAPDLLPVLLSYASILDEVGGDEAARRLLNRLGTSFHTRPRFLGALSEEDSLAFPECGVGSPHRIGVTIYYDADSPVPVRVTGAGMTADATLTAQVFTNVYSAALACNDEPTLITTGAWSLTMSADGSSQSGSEGVVLSAVLTPSGAGEPTKDTPTLGMTAQESLAIIADSFERLQEATGLVRVMRWQRRDADKLESRVRALLDECRVGVRVLKSDPHHTEGASVIHVMPLLRRSANEGIVPVEIEIPYDTLGPKTVFDLLRKGRNTYMSKLISAAQARQAYARKAWEEQGEAIEAWNRLSEAEKKEICERHPKVTITMQYDWDLGITVRLDPPEPILRATYEEVHRPQIRESAKRKEAEFGEMVEKLEELNRPGGRADILTFKLLIDSMMRKAVIAVPDDEFQHQYEHWVNTCSGPVWAAVEVWARTHGLSPESLAADNICFNAQVRPRARTVRLIPMVLVDLHDFLIRIDGAKGIMEVSSGGKKTALVDCFAPERALGIHTPSDLYTRLQEWMNEHAFLGTIDQDARNRYAAELMADPRIGPRLGLTQAKRALFRGRPDEALAIIGDIRQADIAAIYLWGAIAEQYKALCDDPGFELPVEDSVRNERLLNVSISILIEVLKEQEQIAVDPVEGEQARARRRQSLMLAVPRAIDYLGQLRSCSPESIAALTGKRPDIAGLERESFASSEEMESRHSAAVRALSSLELLSLAETTRNVARRLPFAGKMTDELWQDIRGLVQRKNSLTIASPPTCLELDELDELLESHNDASLQRLGVGVERLSSAEIRFLESELEDRRTT